MLKKIVVVLAVGGGCVFVDDCSPEGHYDATGLLSLGRRYWMRSVTPPVSR